MEPLVSVLLPTRKRIGPLWQSILSIYHKADLPSQIELCIGIDDDDTETQEFVQEQSEAIRSMGFQLQALVGPRPPNGYNGMWQLYTRLYEQSHGEFLLIFNDDAIICNKGWDTALSQHIGEVCVINPRYELTTSQKRGIAMIGVPQNLGDAGNIFPIVSRRIPEITGNFSLHSSIDVWFRLLGEYAGITINEPDIVLMHVGGQDSQHWIDRMPEYDPGGSYKLDDKIRADAAKVVEQTEDS